MDNSEDIDVRFTLVKCQERLDFLEAQSIKIKGAFILGAVIVAGICFLNNHKTFRRS